MKHKNFRTGNRNKNWWDEERGENALENHGFWWCCWMRLQNFRNPRSQAPNITLLLLALKYGPVGRLRMGWSLLIPKSLASIEYKGSYVIVFKFLFSRWVTLLTNLFLELYFRETQGYSVKIILILLPTPLNISNLRFRRSRFIWLALFLL